MNKETKTTETKKSENIESKKLSEEELKNTKGGGFSMSITKSDSTGGNG